MATASKRTIRSVSIPGGTLLLLIAIMTLGNIGQGTPAGAQEYFDRVAAQIDAVPYVVGDWFGMNLPYTEVEVQMLRPNKMLQRTYQDPTTGQKASLSIVHCTDIRDMQGHFPPNCYPSHGWNLDSSELMGITFDGREQQARFYVFSRTNRGTRETIEIVSFFAVPNSEGIVSEMDALSNAAKNPQAAGLGAAQVQILTPASQSQATKNLMISKILEAVEPVVQTVQEGVK